MRSVQVSSAGESAGKPAIFRNDVIRQMLREFMGYDPKGKNGSDVYETILSIERPESCEQP